MRCCRRQTSQTRAALATGRTTVVSPSSVMPTSQASSPALRCACRKQYTAPSSRTNSWARTASTSSAKVQAVSSRMTNSPVSMSGRLPRFLASVTGLLGANGVPVQSRPLMILSRLPSMSACPMSCMTGAVLATRRWSVFRAAMTARSSMVISIMACYALS